MRTPKKVIVPGVSIWPQPKTNPRMRYRITYGPRKDRTTEYASTDLETTVDRAREISKRLERRRTGQSTRAEQRHDDQDRKTIAEHLEEYRQALVAAGNTPKHVRQMHSCARWVLLGTGDANERKGRGIRKVPELEGVGATRISELTRSLIQREVGKVKAARSAATANRYLEAVNGFLNWGVEDERWERNVASTIRSYPVEPDRRWVRRAIPMEDLARLVKAVEQGEIVAGVVGAERALLYRTCFALGIRANESRNLRKQDVILTPDMAAVAVQAKTSKNKKKTIKPIPRTLAEQLLEHAADKAPEDSIFRVPCNTARMLRADLAACDPPIPYKLNGEVFDFHSLRHQSGAFLVAAGVDPKTVQIHMRHSTITLTMNTYGHVFDDSQERALGALSGLSLFEKAQRPAQRATGSDVRFGSLEFAGAGEGTNEKPASSSENAGSEVWSHGESNPDLLNAIQPSSR